MSSPATIVGKFRPPTNKHIDTISHTALTARLENQPALNVIIKANKMADVAKWLLGASLPPEIKPIVHVQIGFSESALPEDQGLLLGPNGKPLEIKTYKLVTISGADVWVPSSPKNAVEAKTPSTRKIIVGILERGSGIRQADIELDKLVPPLVRDTYVLACDLFHLMAGKDASIEDHVKLFNKAFRAAAENMGMPKRNLLPHERVNTHAVFSISPP